MMFLIRSQSEISGGMLHHHRTTGELLAPADQALFMAKKMGRNNMVFE